jgi:hypothetical protein
MGTADKMVGVGHMAVHENYKLMNYDLHFPPEQLNGVQN